MKRIALILLAVVGLRIGAHAQWTVYDPAVHSQQIISTAQEIAKFVEMINNQVQQIRQLTDQANTLRRYVDLFGNPASVAPISVNPLTADLRKAESGKTLFDLERAVNATVAMTYSGNGLFHVIGEQFTTPNGSTIKRRERPYLPIAAAQKTTDNYLNVSKDASARRVALKSEIAKTIDALKAARTDAEVQKLTGLLVGLGSALDSTDNEVSQATASAVVQDIANRADERRQVEAKKEQQHAEFTEAVDKYGKTFRLMNAPVKFPSR